MKRIICIIAAALALTLLASGILSACDANNSASAANAGKNSAKKIDATVSRLENLDDKDFNFPAVLGSDFFLNETATDEECPPGTECGPVTRNIDTERGYHAKHFGKRKLNQNSKARTKFLEQFDDLYVLSADIVAANAKCNELTDAIKQESKQLKQLSNEIKKTGKKGKDIYAAFNYNNRQLNESVTKLYRDRNSIKAKVNSARRKSNTGSLDIEAATSHNKTVLSKIEKRLCLLEDTHAKLVKMNQNLRAIMGKAETSIQSESVENPNAGTVPDMPQPPPSAVTEQQQANFNETQLPENMPETQLPTENSQKQLPEPQYYAAENQNIPRINIYRRPIREQHPAFRTNRSAYKDFYDMQHDINLDNQKNPDQQQLDEQNQTDADKPVMISRFRTLPYVFPC